MSYVSAGLYSQVVKSVPILCVDVIVTYRNQYVLVKRKNNPLEGEWWVPGGRVLIGEMLEQAVTRKLSEELNLEVDQDLELIGLYEDVFSESAMGSHVYQTMAVVFGTSLEVEPLVTLDATSSDWKLSDELPIRFTNKLRGVEWRKL